MDNSKKWGTFWVVAAIAVVWLAAAGAASFLGQGWEIPIVISAFTLWLACVAAALSTFLEY